MNQKNKLIISTLGPSSLRKEIVQKMDESGVDVFRINLSHTNIDDYKKICLKLKKWTSKQICPDTEGAQLRTGLISNDKKNSLFVESNTTIKVLGKNLYHGSIDSIPLQINFEKTFFKKGDMLNIDFNSVIVQVINSKENQINCRVISGGLIGSNKGIDCNKPLDLKTFTDKDNKIIKIANDLKQKTIFLSFCSSGDNIRQLRKKFSYKTNIIAKIENYKSLANIKSICNEADGILIDRGDLSRVVPIEKIAFAQKEIIRVANYLSTPVYIATNLMESMIERAEPTRAEVNDIVASLDSGAAGLVLAAETAIGKYPIKCVRTMKKIITEHFKYNHVKLNEKISDDKMHYLTDKSTDDIIPPHGGVLCKSKTIDYKEFQDDLQSLKIDSNLISDIFQISIGTYSPIRKFMNQNELYSVLDNYSINGTPWTMPIIFQVSKSVKDKIIHEKKVLLVDKKNSNPIGIINIDVIEPLNNMKLISKKWFGTDNEEHPGVMRFLQNGAYIISGEVTPFNNLDVSGYYSLSPQQSRNYFSLNHWKNIIGFHTRNLCHSGHLFIQQEALKKTNADAIFISPVVGSKKSGDFKPQIIIDSYEALIKANVFNPFGALVGSFDTYSRYSGPREAVFTALCRKNFGCNYFLIGRDHTGIGKYYKPKDSQKIFSEIDTGMNIIKFDKVSYCAKRKIITDNFNSKKYEHSELELSGSLIRNLIINDKEIPNYLINENIKKFIEKKYLHKKHDIFE